MRHIIRRASVATAAIACVLATPGSALAGGGIDDTKACVESSAKAWNPLSTRSTLEFKDDLRWCAGATLAHFMDTQKRVEWETCVMYGISRSVPPLGWEPAIYGLVSCSQRFLGFYPQIDPYPSR